ncbi:hypothetical protein B296_00052312, partial [Ensete ventricosum]
EEEGPWLHDFGARRKSHIVPTAVSARMYHAPLGFPLASFQSARAMERGADVVASRGRCSSAAAPHRTTQLHDYTCHVNHTPTYELLWDNDFYDFEL